MLARRTADALQDMGSLYVQMGLIGVGDPHRTVVLHVVGAIARCRLRGDDLGRRDAPSARRIWELQRGQCPEAPGRLTSDGHFGAPMLDCLECADRLAVLLTRLAVVDGKLTCCLSDADERRSAEQ